jgi:hypothetical protein
MDAAVNVDYSRSGLSYPSDAGRFGHWDGLTGLAWIQRILPGSDESCWAPAGLETLMGSDGFW